MLLHDGHRPQESHLEAAGEKLTAALIFQLRSEEWPVFETRPCVGLYEDSGGGAVRLSVFA